MSTKVHHIPAIPGIKETHDFLELVNNKDKLTTVLNQLETARKEANEAIKNKYKASEIDELLGKANADREKAQFELAEANGKADRIIVEANETIEKAEKEFGERRRELDLLQSSVQEAQRIFDNEKNSATELLNKREKEIDKKETELASKIAITEKLRVEYKEKLLRIRKAAEEFK